MKTYEVVLKPLVKTYRVTLKVHGKKQVHRVKATGYVGAVAIAHAMWPEAEVVDVESV